MPTANYSRQRYRLGITPEDIVIYDDRSGQCWAIEWSAVAVMVGGERFRNRFFEIVEMHDGGRMIKFILLPDEKFDPSVSGTFFYKPGEFENLLRWRCHQIYENCDTLLSDKYN